LLVALSIAKSARGQTQRTTRAGDTTVIRTSGDVPATSVRRLTIDWRASFDSSAIGDIGGMAVAPDGRMYLWDPATPAIWLLAGDGKSLTRIGRRGGGPGEYARVNGLAVMASGNLAVWDEGNARVNFYGSDGTFLSSSIVPHAFCCPSNVVTADTLNRLWLFLMDVVARPDKARGDPFAVRRSAFLVLDSQGAIRDTVETPMLPREFEPLIAGTAKTLSARPMPYGGMPRYAASPLGYAVSGTGRPYIVYAASGGRPLRIEGVAAPVAISREERGQLRANLEASMRGIRPDWSWSGPDIPREKPPYSDLRVGLDGRIWVALSVASESFEPDSPAPGRGGRGGPPLPPVGFRARETRWDVYAPDGTFIARVLGPRAFTAYVMRGNMVWGVLRDADDLPMVVRMRF
jgi:hypothetical protein